MQETQINNLYCDTGLSPHMEDYMETIGLLSIRNKVVRVKDIAKKLNIKMPSVSAALNKLKEMKLIEYEKYGFIELTDYGKNIAEMVYKRHSCLSKFFEVVLMMDPEAANNEACKVEHVLTPDTCRRIHKFLSFFETEKESNPELLNRLKEFLYDIN